MAQYQTVIFQKSTGQILKVCQNRYIANKATLAREVSRQDWKDLAFVYFPHMMPLDPLEHSVRRLAPNMPPAVVSADGLPLDFAATLYDRRDILQKGARCLVEFEGGAGDQLMEAAAVLTAMATYPQSTFAIRAEAKYIEMLRHVEGLPQVSAAYVGQARQQFTFVVSNHTQYISDPRGGHYGKASLYGAWLGLSQVTAIAHIALGPQDYEAERQFIDSLNLPSSQLNFAVQFRSGSGHAKSWQHEHVIHLADLLHQTYDCHVFVLGGPNELPAGSPGIIDLTGRTSWWQTVLLESLADIMICIDSGVMHIARSLNKPYIALWGGTNAQVILGEHEAPDDIRLDLDCRDLICYDCQNKTNACMFRITPELVLEKILSILRRLQEATCEQKAQPSRNSI